MKAFIPNKVIIAFEQSIRNSKKSDYKKMGWRSCTLSAIINIDMFEKAGKVRRKYYEDRNRKRSFSSGNETRDYSILRGTWT